MNTNKIDSIRRLLVQKMDALHASAHHTIQRLKTTNVVSADPFDHAAIETCKDVELNCRHKDWHLLLDIQETILRIDHGLFGICDHCGQRIASKRLRALPMSKLCVTCQEEVELQHNKSRRRSQTTERISYHHA